MAFRKSSRFGNARNVHKHSASIARDTRLVGNNIEIASAIQERLASRIPDLLDAIVDYVLDNLGGILESLNLKEELSVLHQKIENSKINSDKDKLRVVSPSDSSTVDNDSPVGSSDTSGFGSDILKEKNNAK
jgi:hypothetical protein